MSRTKKPLNGWTVHRPRAPWSVALCVISLPFSSLFLQGGRSKARRTFAPPRLRRAIGCLVAADYVQKYGLKPIGVKIGDIVWVRYGIGSIPGIGGTPSLWNIIVYSKSGQHATLLFADPNRGGGFEAVRNGYYLVKHHSRWAASGGEGGFRDYEAVGRYATALSRRPRYRVKLLPGNSGCTKEQD